MLPLTLILWATGSKVIAVVDMMNIKVKRTDFDSWSASQVKEWPSVLANKEAAMGNECSMCQLADR